jgi:hypothetical protein
MDTSTSNPDVTTRLANWAASFLASSFVLVAAIFFVAFALAEFPAWVKEHPIGAFLLVVLVAGYLISFVCLARLRKALTRNPLRLWVVSFIASCMPLAVLFYISDGSSAALVVGMAEVGAVILHLVAIAIILSRASPPNSSLERTRER